MAIPKELTVGSTTIYVGGEFTRWDTTADDTANYIAQWTPESYSYWTPARPCRWCGKPFEANERGACSVCGGPPLGWDVRRALD